MDNSFQFVTDVFFIREDKKILNQFDNFLLHIQELSDGSNSPITSEDDDILARQNQDVVNSTTSEGAVQKELPKSVLKASKLRKTPSIGTCSSFHFISFSDCKSKMFPVCFNFRVANFSIGSLSNAI